MTKELDITPQILYRWRKEFSAKQGSSFPGNGKVILTETEQELSRLRKELRDTQMLRDSLKKAVGIFSKSDTNIQVHKGPFEITCSREDVFFV